MYRRLMPFFVLILIIMGCGNSAETQPKPGLVSNPNEFFARPYPLRTFYIDGIDGNDQNDGMSSNTSWQTLEQVSSIIYQPGDHVLFKRDSSYDGCATINGDGTVENPILVGAYGQGAAPSFTNPDNENCAGNAIRIRGDYHIIENLYFHHTAPARKGAAFPIAWATGALHVNLGSDHVVIRNNEFAHIPKAIQSDSEHSLITHNYIHDANDEQMDGFLSWPSWGPIGIHLGIGNQEVSYNIIENMFVEGGQWGGDGGAIEIDNGRNHKDNFHIHHNFTQHNMGFIEISWEHDIRKRPTSNVVIEHNVSRDYQTHVLWWAEGVGSRISNNTIIRTDVIEGMFTDAVFIMDGEDIVVRDNIIVVRDGMLGSVYSGGGSSSVLNANNVYWNIDGGKVDLGIAANESEFTTDPQFVDFDGGDYKLLEGSSAIGLGALNDADVERSSDASSLARDFAPVVEEVSFREATLAAKSDSAEWIRLEDTDPLLGLDGGSFWRGAGNKNSGGSARTLWEPGNSVTVLFEGTQLRVYGSKAGYMNSADIWINGELVKEKVTPIGREEFQVLLWESEVLEFGEHSAEIISNGDTFEVDFIEYR